MSRRARPYSARRETDNEGSKMGRTPAQIPSVYDDHADGTWIKVEKNCVLRTLVSGDEGGASSASGEDDAARKGQVCKKRAA